MTWRLGDKRDVQTITIRKSSNGRDFTPLSILGKNEVFFLEEKPFSQTYYQLTINELSGKSTKSKIILVEQKTKNKVQIYPSVTNGFLTIEHVQFFEIINSVGQMVLSEKAFYQSSVNIYHLPNGIYFVKGMDTEGSVFFQKIVKQ